MLALYRAGRQSEALDAYRAARAGARRADRRRAGRRAAARCTRRILAQDPALDLPAAAAPRPDAAPRPLPRAARRRAAARRRRRARARRRRWRSAIIRVLEPDGLAGIDEDHVGLIDPDGGRITAQYAVGHSPGRGRRRAPGRCGSPTGSTARSRASTAGATRSTTIPVGGAPAALAFGAGSLWVADGDGAHGRAGRPRLEQGRCSGSRPATRRARWRVAEGALWVVSGADGSVHRDRPRPRDARGARDPPRREGDARSPPAPGRSGWRARRPAPSPASTRASGDVVAADQRRQRAERAGGGRGRGVGRQPRRRHAVAHRPGHERGVGASARVGRGPDARSRSARARCGWPAARTGPSSAIDPDGPRVLTRRTTGSSPSALAVADGLGVDRRGRARGGAPGRHAARRHPRVPRAGRRTGCTRTATTRAPWMLARWRTTGSSPTAASPASPGATLVGGAGDAAAARRARTGAPTSSRCDAASATPTARRSARATSARRWSATCVSASDAFPPFFTGIVGARRCISDAGALRPLARHRVGCARADDHRPPDRARRGVPAQADAALRVRRAARHAGARGSPGPQRRPAPGPYRVASWDVAARRRARPQPALPSDRRAARRVRRPDRGRDQPAGTLEAHAAAVERGSADLTSASVDLPSLRGQPRRTSSHARPASCTAARHPTSWMFLNVRRPPFDDLRVRRALNFATDRAALVELVRRSRGRRSDLPDRADRVPGLLALLPLHRQPVARRRMDRAGPRARAPTGRGVGPGRHARDRGRRRGGATARRPLLRLAVARPRLPCAAARDARRRRLLPGGRAARLARADGGGRLGRRTT